MSLKETLSQRNALLERLLAMQQQAASARPSGRGRSAIEAQKESWWLSQDMRVSCWGLNHGNLDYLMSPNRQPDLLCAQATHAVAATHALGRQCSSSSSRLMPSWQETELTMHAEFLSSQHAWDNDNAM